MGRKGEHPGVFERAGPAGKRWCFRYRYQGRWIRRAAPRNTQASAQRILDRVLEAIDRGADPGRVGKPTEAVTVSQVLTEYVDVCRASKKRALRRYADFERSLSGQFGSRQVSGIDENLLLDYRANRNAAKACDATVNRELAFLRAALNRAKQTGKIQGHFFDGLQTRESRRRVFPQESPARNFQRVSDEDLRAILNELPESIRDGMRRVCGLALLSGMRRSEVFTLEWSSILSDRIRLIRTKSGRAREIPLTKAMRELLPPRRIDGGPVFRTAYGDPMPQAFGIWREAASQGKRSWIRFHDLRHEWASRYVEAGGDLVSLMEVGGWSQLSLVQRYAKASHDRIRATLEMVGSSTPDSTRVVLPGTSA